MRRYDGAALRRRSKDTGLPLLPRYLRSFRDAFFTHISATPAIFSPMKTALPLRCHYIDIYHYCWLFASSLQIFHALIIIS